VRSFDNNGVLAFAATYNGVYVSADHGNSWSQINFGLTDTIVYSVTCNGTFAFAGTDSSVWRRPLSELPTGVFEIANKTNNISIYPNPTSNELRIETNSNQKYFVQLFDINGKVVTEEISFTQIITLVLTNQREGIYFLIVKDEKNNLVKTQKVVFIK
jgi:Secretion system C-terminal sorting domain